jgi:putative ABC transport system permease protein
METAWKDLRFALRTLAKNPGFAAVAILTLALGFGANTAIFSVVNAVLLRPLPFRDSDRICLLTERLRTAPSIGPSYQNYRDWRDQAQSFEGVFAARNATFTLTGLGDPERIPGQQVTASFFGALGVNAIVGRTFLPEEDKPGGAPVALVGYGLWQRRFGGTPDVLGKGITLDNQTYSIVGVLPASFQLFQQSDVLLPFEPWAATLPDDRSWHQGIIAMGRLKPGVSLERASAEMTAIAKRLEQQYPVYDTDVGANVFLLHDRLVQNVRPALLVLLAAVGLVLLIACGNIANLLLARASSRNREMAIRTAIGAASSRLVRQLLTESFVLAIAGSALGLLLAKIAMVPLVQLAGNTLPNVGPIGIDRGVLFFTGSLAILAGIIFGLAPALQAGNTDLRSVLNEATRGSTGGARQIRLRNVLAVAEVALAMLLLISAGLLIRSFDRLANVEPGFHPQNLLVADIPVSQRAYPRDADRMEYFDQMIERTAALPGVTTSAFAQNLPVSGTGGFIHFNIQGHPPKDAHDYIATGYRVVSTNYLQLLGVPLLQGRMLAQSDNSEHAPYVVVINQSMARQYFPGESPLGKHVQLGALPENEVPWMEVVGVVGDMKQSLDSDAKSEMFVPYRQANSMLPFFQMSIVLRTARDPRQEISALRSAIQQLNPNQPLVRVRTMDEAISGSVSDSRFRTLLLGIFAGSALLLSVIGLYGLMAYSVTQRVQEIGIRMTLGAQPSDVLRMVVGQGVRLALIGIAIGVGGALAFSRVLSKFLYGVTATDPLTYTALALVLAVVTAIACYIPARRATKVDPMVALRYE